MTGCGTSRRAPGIVKLGREALILEPVIGARQGTADARNFNCSSGWPVIGTAAAPPSRIPPRPRNLPLKALVADFTGMAN
jgi:hypothetical protein